MGALKGADGGRALFNKARVTTKGGDAVGIKASKPRADKGMRDKRLRRLPTLLARYLIFCRPPDGGDARKDGRFPNLAGLCAFLGCGLEEASYWKEQDPTTYGYVMAVLEDEALNSPVSSALINSYLKQRFGYGEREEAARTESTDCGSLRLIFEHDIGEDGA